MDSGTQQPSPATAPRGPSDQSEADSLENRTDDELRALAGRIVKILSEREEERKKEAMAQIEEIAKRHGLAVTVGQAAPKKRRGRPRKKPE